MKNNKGREKERGRKNLQQGNNYSTDGFRDGLTRQDGIASEPPTNNPDSMESRTFSETVSLVEHEQRFSVGQEASSHAKLFWHTVGKQVQDLVEKFSVTKKELERISEQVKALAADNPRILEDGKKIRGYCSELAGSIFTVNSSVKSLDTKAGGIDKKIGVLDEKINGVLKKRDFDYTASNIRNDIKTAFQTLVTRFQNDLQPLQGLSGKISQEARGVTEEVRKLSRVQQNAKAELSPRLTSVESKLKSIGESTDLIQSLPGKIDGITELLSAKGLRIKQSLPAMNHDEETLAQLAEYGEEIFQQLATAARWYARLLPEQSKHKETIDNLNAAHQKEKETAYQNGQERGRKEVVKSLLSVYDQESLHELLEPAEDADGRLKILATFLKNQGVEPIYQMHEELEITQDNLMNYEHNIAELRPGKIVITSPGYTFDTETISKAKYMTAEEFHAAQSESPSPEEIPSDETSNAGVAETGEVTIVATTNNETSTEENLQKG